MNHTISSSSYFSLSNCSAKFTAWLLDANRFFSIILSMKLIISSSKATLVLNTFFSMIHFLYPEVYKLIVIQYPIIANITEKYIKGVFIKDVKQMLQNSEVYQKCQKLNKNGESQEKQNA